MNRFEVLALLGGCLSIPSLANAQSVPMATTTIDATRSGDCKAIGDIDRDGKADAILGGSSLVWYEAGASFSRWVIRPQVVYAEFTTDCQSADVDGDGDSDIVIGDGDGTGNLLWFENPTLAGLRGGSDPRIGSNWNMHIIGTHGETVHDIEVADLDRDGKLDVVSSGHGFTHIWKGNGAASWQSRDISSLAGSGVFLGDIDRDGFTDIATPRGWIRNPGAILTGTWTFHSISGATSGDECLLGDLNGDGRLDLLTCDAHQRAAFVWFEQPTTATSASWTKRTIDASMGAHHPEIADFDRDGRPDILMGLELAEIAIYLNQGGGIPTFQKQQVATSGGHNARAGDLDGDGFIDILACDYIGNPPVRIHINQLTSGACYANCDGSSQVPALTANDFQCFLNRFSAGDSYANCDGSTGNPILTANDFQCFIDRFAAGCS